MRTQYCGELSVGLIDQQVTLAGWVHRRRDHGGVIFIDLRDHTGYILEATVPPGMPLPMLFQVSLQILDNDGNRVRYNIDADGQRIPANTETLQ